MYVLRDITFLNVGVQDLDQEVKSVFLDELLLEADGDNVISASRSFGPEVCDVVVLVREECGSGVVDRVGLKWGLLVLAGTKEATERMAVLQGLNVRVGLKFWVPAAMACLIWVRTEFGLEIECEAALCLLVSFAVVVSEV